MEVSDWLSIIAIIVSLLAAGFTGWQAISAHRSANVQEKEFNLKQNAEKKADVRIGTLEITPSMWGSKIDMYYFNITNESNTVATNVRIYINDIDAKKDPDAFDIEGITHTIYPDDGMTVHIDTVYSIIPEKAKVIWDDDFDTNRSVFKEF